MEIKRYFEDFNTTQIGAVPPRDYFITGALIRKRSTLFVLCILPKEFLSLCFVLLFIIVIDLRLHFLKALQ